MRVPPGFEPALLLHPRSFDKDACIEIPQHIAEVARHKRQARRLRGQDRLFRAAPDSERLLAEAACPAGCSRSGRGPFADLTFRPRRGPQAFVPGCAARKCSMELA